MFGSCMPEITIVRPSPDIKVVLHKDDSIYTAGDVIQGHLEVTVPEPTRIKDVFLVIYGAARVTWEEAGTSYIKGAATTTTKHQNIEVYLDYTLSLTNKEHNTPQKRASKTSLVQTGEEEQGELFGPGKHNYPFECNLPRFLPASFTGKWGKITYTLKGALERLWKSNITDEVELEILGYSDLNTQLDLVRPTGSVGCFRSGVICCKSAPINCELRVDRRGFVPGENIPFHVEIENNSGKSLHNVRVVIQQQVHFHFGDTSKKRNLSASSVKKGEVLPRTTLRWDEVIPLPFLPPSGNSHATAIQIKYALVLCVNHSSLYDDFMLSVNIAVGTIPFRQSTIKGYLALLAGLGEASPRAAEQAARAAERGSRAGLASETSVAYKHNSLDSPRYTTARTGGHENLNIHGDESDEENT